MLQIDKNYPKVTVVTVCFNVKEALLLTANNVFQQDYPSLEYVIVDGASTDGTVEPCKTWARNSTNGCLNPIKASMTP